MHDVLYFPHYTPSSENLRALLLFYEELKTIVPGVDQRHVSNREHVAELLSVGCKINYFDPSYQYSDWFDDAEVHNAFKRLVNARSKRTSRSFDKIEFDSSGVAEWDQDGAINEFVDKGWSLIAAQKIPYDELQALRSKRVAIPMRIFRHPVTGQVVEENPVLMHPDIGEFILARLAREISKQERVAAVTFENRHFCNQAYAPSVRNHEERDLLMSAIVSMSIPDDLDTLRSGDYAEVREAYAPARLKLESMTRELSENYRLDRIADFEQLTSAVKDAASDIERRVQTAVAERRTIRYQAHKVLNQNIVWGIGASIAGYAIGGPIGAAAGGLISPLAADLAERLSPPKRYEMVETLASIRGSITRGARRSKVTLPKYMI